MGQKRLKNEFGVYFDPNKITSGQRFFSDLSQTLSDRAIPLSEHPRVILFNVSAPLKEMVKAKLRGQKVVLRIDSLYFDRLSPAFLASFYWPLRMVFSIGLKYSRYHDLFAFMANMINQNYGAFSRILLADRIIYQSKFSKKVHDRYFHRKPCTIIVNGSAFRSRDNLNRVAANHDEIFLVTTYDWRPSKRIHDIIAFMQWACVIKKTPLRLAILGYTGEIPTCVSTHVKTIIETNPYIRTLPSFTSYSGEIRDILLNSDMYITFTYRDSCPNVIIESMAHGLPVVGIESGGVSDIVGDAGVLIPVDDFKDGFFSPHRYEGDFPPIDFEKVMDAVFKLSSNRAYFQTRVQERFATDLDINVVAARYASVLRSVVDEH